MTTRPTTQTDRIEKKVLLRAPLARVWRAITDSKEFGTWFGMRLDAPFKAGATLRATIVPTTVDPEVAKMQKEFEGAAFDIEIDAIEPQRLFSFRWHPHGLEKGFTPTKEERTLVAFRLEESPEGVLLTITESGFDKIPLAYRAKAFASNEGGWAGQCELIAKYLAHAA
jgi:uncharacterized protein YndB with AHSA1/START domain